MLQTVKAEKIDEKMRGHLSSLHVTFLKLSKKVHFLIRFMGVWAITHNILATKTTKMISPKQLVVNNEQYHFLKVRNEAFNMHICKLL